MLSTVRWLMAHILVGEESGSLHWKKRKIKGRYSLGYVPPILDGKSPTSQPHPNYNIPYYTYLPTLELERNRL